MASWRIKFNEKEISLVGKQRLEGFSEIVVAANPLIDDVGNVADDVGA